MDDIMSSIDESQMERVLGELAHDAENMNEDDPKQMAQVMRKFSEKTGLNLGNGMEEALARMEAGEDPEKIEQEMGDVLEGEDPFAMGGKKGKKGSYRSQPVYDETLYEL
ncbi:MAG: zinc ribbon domain-containing protein, partial [Desulfobulbaceae bacterium]|nr:zinc ribbon domain-containing protein [Desulfobulbaceae bacterium]